MSTFFLETDRVEILKSPNLSNFFSNHDSAERFGIHKSSKLILLPIMFSDLMKPGRIINLTKLFWMMLH